MKVLILLKLLNCLLQILNVRHDLQVGTLYGQFKHKQNILYFNNWSQFLLEQRYFVLHPMANIHCHCTEFLKQHFSSAVLPTSR